MFLRMYSSIMFINDSFSKFIFIVKIVEIFIVRVYNVFSLVLHICSSCFLLFPYLAFVFSLVPISGFRVFPCSHIWLSCFPLFPYLVFVFSLVPISGVRVFPCSPYLVFVFSFYISRNACMISPSHPQNFMIW